MAPISFVIVKPGKRATAASKHEERVGIHSHAQKVTQQRKRDQRQKEEERVRTAISSSTGGNSNSSRNNKVIGNEIARRFKENHDIELLVDSVRINNTRMMPYGLPTPSPEPETFHFDRPFTDHSQWTQDHKYGLSMFLHLTILDINEVATNMKFWKEVVPAYSQSYTCIRDIVSAIACANQAIITRDNDLILTALKLHLQAIAALRRDLTSLPLSAQVASCLLFDAFNVLRCDFVQAGNQIATAKQLTSSVQLDTYLEDSKLPLVCDTLNRMSQSSAWSLWNPSYFLRYESLRHAEPNLYIELQPIDTTTQGTLTGLVQSMERLSRHFAGRIRRNLSERACVDSSSRLARDVLLEFKTWKDKFDKFVYSTGPSGTSEDTPRPSDRATIQQAELAWHFTCVTFTTGVLSSDPTIYDSPIYTPYYTRINDLAEQRFTESSLRSTSTPIKAFLQIIIPSVWLVILMCRDPRVRERSINVLQGHTYQEGEFNSQVTATIAEIVCSIETRGLPLSIITSATDIPLNDRIQVEGIKYITSTSEISLRYSPAISNPHVASTVTEKRIKYTVKGDVTQFCNAVLALSQSCTLYRKVRSDQAPMGYIKGMYYRGEKVGVIVDV